MDEFNLSHALDIGLFRARINYWKQYKDSPIRKSLLKTPKGLIEVCQLEEETIYKMLDIVSQDWAKLLRHELEFRRFDWKLFERLGATKVEIVDPVLYF